MIFRRSLSGLIRINNRFSSNFLASSSPCSSSLVTNGTLHSASSFPYYSTWSTNQHTSSASSTSLTHMPQQPKSIMHYSTTPPFVGLNDKMDDEKEKEVDKGTPTSPSTPPSLQDKAMTLLPGVATSAMVMGAGFQGANVLSELLLTSQGLEYTGTNPISGIPVSILLGLALNNAVTLPASLKPGLKFCTTQALRTGIILVGLKLSMYDIASLGVAGIPCVVASIGTGLAFVTWASKKMGLPPRLGALTAAGTSICGVTAIVSLAPAIKATEKEVSLAVANVVAFGLLGMLSYPYLAHATLDTSEQIGLFLGTAVHDTSQVIGSALTYSEMYKDEVVLKAAAVTKLTRNLFLAGVIPLLAFQTSKAVHAAEVAAAAGAAGTGAGTGSSSGSSGSSSSGKGSKGGPKVSFKTLFPTFILGFLAMALLRTLGDAGLAEGKKKKEEGQLQADEKPVALGCIEEDQWKSGIKFLSGQVGSNVCLGTAMAAVGLSTSFSVFKGVGFKPFALGMAGAAVVGGMGFTMAKVLGPYVHLSSESGSVSKTPNTQAA